ncbi:hypothetical protein ACSSWA_01495 [Melioribacter sp. Ez-97]|uniref:hypothetical protein n=1 Tax=Melioribacter sp. Ez-97 TaxID=3423434 RepID=UPI003ED87360
MKKNNQLKVEINVSEILDAVSPVDLIDRLAQELYKKIYDDTCESERKEIIAAYCTLKKLHIKLLEGCVYNDRRMRTISVN